MKRKALGKGLSALLPVPEVQTAPTVSPQEGPALELAVDEITPNPRQPRTNIDGERLNELAQSIAASGVVQPILVRPAGSAYEIVAGERRWRAARLAGLTRVPAIVRDIPDERVLEIALIENIQRQELSPIEEAQAYQRLQDELGIGQEGLAQRVGKDRATIANTLRLLRLPREIRELLGAGKLGGGHGRALLALEREEEQLALAREAARRGLSVREVERRVAATRAAAQRAGGKTVRSDANTAAAEERLRAALGTRVQIVRGRRAGQVRILFSGEAELNRLYELLLRAGRAPRA